MDGNHPNQKKDKLNSYTLSIENGIYYISFSDGQGILHKQEISMELYTAFNSFELDDITLMNETSRHLTDADTSDLILNVMACNTFHQAQLLTSCLQRSILAYRHGW